MQKMLMLLFSMVFSGALKGVYTHRQTYVEIMRTKMSLMYLKGVKTSRLLFLSLLGVGICLLCVLAGLALLHTTLFLYAPWSGQTKMIIGLVFSAMYLGIGGMAFRYIFDQGKWLKMFHAEDLLDDQQN